MPKKNIEKNAASARKMIVDAAFFYSYGEEYALLAVNRKACKELSKVM